MARHFSTSVVIGFSVITRTLKSVVSTREQSFVGGTMHTSGFQGRNNVKVVGRINSCDQDGVDLLVGEHLPELLGFEDGSFGSALPLKHLVVVLRSDSVFVTQGDDNRIWSLSDTIDPHKTSRTGAHYGDSSRVRG